MGGPFCVKSGLDFSPLEQLLAHAVQVAPQVLVLLGPLLDAGNDKVTSGDTTLPGEDEPLSYEEVYIDHILPLLEQGLARLHRAAPATQVFISPSLEEVLCFHPLPQPPLDAALGLGVEAFRPLLNLGVQLLPNPAHLVINGLRVSISSADALKPVAGELVVRSAGRKIDEALRLLLLQRTLFPVIPRDPPQVSEMRAAALDFPDGRVPDICVFPSVVGQASGTVVDSTLFVNPGLLCRAVVGTFAEVFFVPPEGGRKAPLSECMRVDIQKLG